jgi:5-methylcytosine-specific restriction enzyme A
VSRARGGTVFHVERQQRDEILGFAGGSPFPEEHGLPDLETSELVPHHRYRRSEIHANFGGQRQGAISTPADQPVVLLFSTPGGDEFGSRDGWSEEGVYDYTGEGQVGDMQFIRGNLAIRGHSEAGKELLLFEGQGDGSIEFVGRMAYVGHRIEEGPDRNGNPRSVIIFQLAPIEFFLLDQLPLNTNEVFAPGSGPETLLGLDLAALRTKALDSSSEEPSSTADRIRRVWMRSQAVRLYALRRAMGVCEGCDEEAPFVTPRGEPFLEVHHLKRVSDGGPDRPEAVAAVCPNCHRRSDHAVDARVFNREVEARVRLKEAQLGFSA